MAPAPDDSTARLITQAKKLLSVPIPDLPPAEELTLVICDYRDTMRGLVAMLENRI